MTPLANPAIIRPPSSRVELAGDNSRLGVVYGADRRDALLSSVTRVNDTRSIWVAVWCQGGDYGIDGILGLTLDDVGLPDNAVVRHYYGTAAQQPDPVLVQDVPGYDDALVYADPITGKTIAIAYSVIELDSAAGVPRFAATIRGLKLYDPRTDIIAWTDNAGLCLADAIQSPVYGMGRTATHITEGADFCDELISGQRRNRVGLSIGFSADETPRQRIDNLAMYAQCYVVPDGAGRKIKPQIYRAPVRTITNDDLADSDPEFSVAGFDEVPNARRIIFRDTQSVPWREHPGVAYPAAGAQSLQTQYDESNTDLPGILWGGQAARHLARLVARDNGAAVSTSIAVLGSGFGLERGDNLQLELGDITGEFLITLMEYSDEQGEYSIDLVPESVEFYPDDSEFIELLPVPYVPRSDSEEPPNIQGVFSGGGVYIEGADGTIHNRVRVDLSTPTDKLSFDHYEVRFRPLNSGAPWQEASVTGYTAFLEPVKEGVEYEFDVRTINKKGAGSEWVSGTHTVQAKDIPPPAAIGMSFSITALGTATISATYPFDPPGWGGLRWEYRAGGGYLPLIDGLTKKRIVESAALPTGSITFRVRSEDETRDPVTGLRNASDWYYHTVSITRSADGIWTEVDSRINTESNRNDGQDGDIGWQQNTKNPALDGYDSTNAGNITTEKNRNNNQDGTLVTHTNGISTESNRNTNQDGALSVHGGDISTQKYTTNPAFVSADNSNSSQISTERGINQTQNGDISTQKYTTNPAFVSADNSNASDINTEQSNNVRQDGTLGLHNGQISAVETAANNARIDAGSAYSKGVEAWNHADGVKVEFDAVKTKLITTENLYAQNINADQITAGTLSADRISGGGGYSSITMDGVTANNMVTGTLVAHSHLSTVTIKATGYADMNHITASGLGTTEAVTINGVYIRDYVQNIVNAAIAAHFSSYHVGGGGGN